VKKFTRVEPTHVQTAGDAFPLPIVIKHYRTDDGKEHEFTTFYAEGSRGVCVIPLTSDYKVVTVYEFRAGPERWMHELPGGELHSDETPQEGALRELEEEVGYTSDELVLLGTTTRTAYINEQWYCFMALNCQPLPDGNRPDKEELDQGIETRIISVSDLIRNAKTDQMTDAGAVLMAYEKLMEVQNEAAESH
jgi:ADP-ribose pyrophosphatase